MASDNPHGEAGSGPRHGREGGGPRYGREGGGPRGDRPGRPGDGGGYSVKARLRAKARKKARKQQRRLFQRKKLSRFTTDRSLKIDYKDPKMLRSFLTETGKIIPRRISGNTASQQRKLAQAIKRARHLALLPYATSHQ